MRVAVLLVLGCASGDADAVENDASATDAAAEVVVETSAPPTDSMAPVADTAVCDPPVDPALFDLDGDGKPDTRLAIAACAGATCLTVAGGKEIKLGDGPDSCGSIAGARIRPLGASRVAVVHCAGARVTLAVVDVAKGTIVASARAPIAQKHAWTDVLRDPSGALHPFLAPSYGDAAPPDPTYGVGATWGYACIYDPARASDATRCGAGFASFNVAPATTFFREVGGYSIDMNGDGWEDPTFIFHQRVLSISGANGAVLSNLEYDVASGTEPASPKWFHSGRNYGSHSALLVGGAVRVVEIGATPVGSFTDYNCNVSRFVTVLRGTPLTLGWSRYVGFASTIFSRYEQAYAADPTPVIARKGNFVDKCLHRFSDGRTTIDGTPSVMYAIFHAKAWSTCLVQQYALYLGDPADPDPEKRPWSPSKQKAWGDCQSNNLKARGGWAMEALSEASGTSVTGSTGTYVWGWTNRLTKSGETLYLVEILPAEHAFDLSDVPPSKLRVYALVKGLWTDRGTLPVAARPKLAAKSAAGPRGMGSYSAFAELSLRDIDCDGLPELELLDGTFVGASSDGFVVKK